MSDSALAEPYAVTVPVAIPQTVAGLSFPKPPPRARGGAAAGPGAAPAAPDAAPGDTPPEPVAAVTEKAPEKAPKKQKAPRKRHLHVVGHQSRLRVAPEHRTRLLLGLAATLAVVVAFGLVYLHVIAAQRQFTLDDLNNQVTGQESSYERLRLEVAQLSAPSRIISYAENVLGMEDPGSVTYLTPTEPAPASPAATPPTQAPGGDSDWPQVKSVLAGTP